MCSATTSASYRATGIRSSWPTASRKRAMRWWSIWRSEYLPALPLRISGLHRANLKRPTASRRLPRRRPGAVVDLDAVERDGARAGEPGQRRPAQGQRAGEGDTGENVSDYTDFLSSKRILLSPSGLKVTKRQVHKKLFPFQRDLVLWSVRKGRAAIFADTGLGKTFIQVEWARLVGARTLIVAPLSVSRQTVREAEKIGVAVHYTRSGNDLIDGLNITNYEMAEHFDPAKFGAVVLDESSILKALDGKTRQRLTEMFSETPYRLCCTATPAPNDISEIANHAEFLGIMSRADMLATFFVHDDDGWRLKKHAA